MEGWFYQFPLLVFIGAVLVVLMTSLGFVFLAKQFFNGSKKKSVEDRLLLRQLLEGFGLEVPAELKEVDGSVINTIEAP